MTDGAQDDHAKPVPANDNGKPDDQRGEVKADATETLDALVMSIARLLGRQMAREDFAVRSAANDNRKSDAVDDSE